MSFCIQCGSEVPGGAKFCPECGKPVGSMDGKVVSSGQSQDKRETWDGAIKKCPQCGEALTAFSTTCHACGYELREAKASSSVRDFSDKLAAMSTQMHASSIRSMIGAIKDKIAPEEDPRTDLIRNFPIPNTKEDLVEFIILAASNVNPDVFSERKSASLPASEKSLSRAWLSKLDQAYQKALISLKDDPDLEALSQLYESTKEKVRKAQLGMKRFFVK